ncbi:MAG: DUF357 domain-containing protein [Methanosarcinaceae archaeon]|nr:DUF357 domain-containing protein [Methanosarcinaceae archaeon]
MVADMGEKVKRYERLLREGLEKAKVSPIEESHLYRVAKDFRTMAESYYSDGVHFIRMDDPVNALVCFSYGHAWLDAGVKLGIFNVDDETLFTI